MDLTKQSDRHILEELDAELGKLPHDLDLPERTQTWRETFALRDETNQCDAALLPRIR